MKIPIISFFTGGGLLDMGFEKAGYKTVYANEHNVKIAKAFKYSFNKWAKNSKKTEINPNTKSINDILIDDIIVDAFKNDLPKHFGVIGGPPCQDFSVSGDVVGLKGERGNLTLSFIEKVTKLSPTFFVMENVKGLMSFKTLKNDFQVVKTMFEKDYYLAFKIHNSLSYKVPQHRERMIIIGVRRDLINVTVGNNLNELINYEKYSTDYNLKSLAKNLQTGKYLINNGADSDKIKNHVFPNLKEKTLIKVKAIKEGDTKRRSFRRISRTSYSPTLSFGHNEIFLHPTEHRRLSVRECLRLQGVDDSYQFEQGTTLTTMYKILSNGVPVPMAKGIGLALKDFLEKYIL